MYMYTHMHTHTYVFVLPIRAYELTVKVICYLFNWNSIPLTKMQFLLVLKKKKLKKKSLMISFATF